MNKKDLERFDKILRKEQNRVTKEMETLESANNSTEWKGNSNYGIHMAEAGSEEEELEKNLFFLSREGDILSLIDEALNKIKNGEFGICEQCGGMIPKGRLIAKPFAKYCIDCRKAKELTGTK